MYDDAEDARARAPIAVRARLLSARQEISQTDIGMRRVVEVVRWQVSKAVRGGLHEGQEFQTSTQLDPPCCGMAVLQALRAGHPGEKLKREWWLFFSTTEATQNLMIMTCSQSQPAD